MLKIVIKSIKVKIMGPASIKKVVYVSLLSFFLAVLLAAFYCHNSSPASPCCSICKVNASLSGTFSKGKFSRLSAVGVNIWSMALFLIIFTILPGRNIVIIDPHITFPFSNKAPPAGQQR
jgi:hypothetical protein